MRNHRQLMQLIQNNCNKNQETDYRVQQKSPLAIEGENRPAILIYDVIDQDWGISAEMVKRSLMNMNDVNDIDVFLNSPGGDVFEATAIHSAFITHPANIHIHIDGLAASAATRVAMSGDTIEIAESAMYMIHYAWTFGVGNANDFRKTADMLDKVDNTIVNDYTQGSNADEDQIRTWMKAETWFTAEEAVQHGFVNSIMQRNTDKQNQSTHNHSSKTWDLSAYKNAPRPEESQNKFPQRERLERFANMLLKTG